MTLAGNFSFLLFLGERMNVYQVPEEKMIDDKAITMLKGGRNKA